MSYNQDSDLERARLTSEGRRLESERANLEEGVKALEAEYDSLRRAEATLTTLLEQATRTGESLEGRVSDVAGDHADGLERLTTELKGVRSRLGQLPSEISTKQSTLVQVVSEFQGLIPRAGALVEQDTALVERWRPTTYGIVHEASELSGENAAKGIVEGIGTKAKGNLDTVTQQVPQDIEVYTWLKGSAAGHGSQSNASGYIDIDTIYGKPTYGEPRFPAVDRVERGLLQYPPMDGYVESWSRIIGVDPIRQASRTVPSVISRGAETLRNYVGRVFSREPSTLPYALTPERLHGNLGPDLMQYYRPLQKIGEIAYDKTKGVAKNVASYVTEATSYLASAVGSILNRGR